MILLIPVFSARFSHNKSITLQSNFIELINLRVLNNVTIKMLIKINIFRKSQKKITKRLPRT